jgi:methyltransferase-like protein/cyclopropane fatty-acyl-phospholipid synthase-like methyltransferase
MNSSKSGNPYDQVLYQGHPFAQTHPDRLATMARLFSMNPAPVEQCRLLELGCGDGGNLIPMAYTLPGSEFMGVDLGARGIEIGCETARALGLANVKLRCLDILQAGAELGGFDYIVAHGVYSWVPAPVQRRILEICRENLKPQGVAYVSYAAYPGAHVRTMMAEMLQYHARRFSEPETQIQQAGALLVVLARAQNGDDAYSRLLRHEAASLSKRRAQSIFHDELAEVQQPVYFRDFAERASRERLQYLGEADFFDMLDASLPPEIREVLDKLARDPIDKEQFLDFLKCRRFRQTLLCHSGVQLAREVDAARMREFYVGTGQCKNKPPERVPSEHPVAAAALAVLLEAWPLVLSFDELKRQIGTDDDALLCALILGYFACGIFQLHVSAPRFATSVSDRPRASAVARLQARNEPFVTNLWHGIVELDDVSLRLLRALDGTRDKPALLEIMREAVPPESLATLEQDLEGALCGLAKLALLEA